MIETKSPEEASESKSSPVQTQEKSAPLSVSMLNDIDLQLTVELGRTMLPIRDVLRLGTGSVIDLAKAVGDPISILANDKLIARGELVVVDSALAVRITEIVGKKSV